MWRIARKLLIILAGFSAILAYGFLYELYQGFESYSHRAKERTEAAGRNLAHEVHIAVVWSRKDDQSFIRGIDIATTEINQAGGIQLKDSKGELIPSRLVIHQGREFDDTSHREANEATQRIVEDTRIVAVLGYTHSSRAVPASSSLEFNDVLYLSTASTQSILTNHRFKFVFSLGPIDTEYFEPIVKFAQKNSVKTLAILYDRNSTGRAFFTGLAAQISGKIKIVYKKSLAPGEYEQLDAIYSAATSGAEALAIGMRDSELAARVVLKLREMGFDKPIFGDKVMDNVDFLKWLKGRGGEIYVASAVGADPVKQLRDRAENLPNSQRLLKMLTDFRERYISATGQTPGFLAYQGYFAIYLFKLACERAGSSVPISVAAALKYTDPRGAALGIVFDDHNRRKDIQMRLKTISGMEFVDVD